jgi:hypothetical protein
VEEVVVYSFHDLNFVFPLDISISAGIVDVFMNLMIYIIAFVLSPKSESCICFDCESRIDINSGPDICCS